jgi:hypothetical protein
MPTLNRLQLIGNAVFNTCCVRWPVAEPQNAKVALAGYNPGSSCHMENARNGHTEIFRLLFGHASLIDRRQMHETFA